MLKSDLEKPFLLDVTASGHVFVRARGEPRRDGFLPFYSTDTRERAEGLIQLHCRRANDGSGTYRLNEWKDNDLDEIDRIADLLRQSDERG